MKKILLLFVLLLSFSIVSCKETETTTYDTKQFYKAMDDIDGVETIYYYEEDSDEEDYLYVVWSYKLEGNETLYFAPRITNQNDRQYINVHEEFSNQYQLYLYVIHIDNPNDEKDRIRFPNYEELIEIFSDYIENNLEIK